ncbi:MAG: hypothetical protein GX638_16665, partial [Crenarchaeota archaeon]|nr:hypothetical protein [Thermoproteota archaeon]
WMPFWDYDYMQFWCKVPLQYRINQAMYKTYVDNLFYKTTGFTLPRDDLKPSIKNSLKSVLSLYINQSFKNWAKKQSLNDFRTDPLANWGRYAKNQAEYNALRRKYNNCLIINCKTYLDEVESALIKNKTQGN